MTPTIATRRTERPTATLTFALILLGGLCQTSWANPVEVAYELRVSTESWMPIRQEDTGRAMADKVLEVLSASGKLRLTPLQRNPLTLQPMPSPAKLLLTIHGDVVGEAGNFSVTLTLRPLRGSDLPSFAAAATVSISKLPKHQMYLRMVSAAENAAQRMQKALVSRLSVIESERRATAVSAKGLFDWGKLTIPKPRINSNDMRLFANRSAKRDDRLAAGRRLSGLAYDRPHIRHLFERVLLNDRDPVMRHYAFRFLIPSSRKYRLTQQIILSVARNDGDKDLRHRAFDLSPSFLGLSLHETLQTWVLLLYAKPTEFERTATLAKILGSRPNVPNLDLALAACLTQTEVFKHKGQERKKACLNLADQLPPARRARLTSKHLEKALANTTKIDPYGPFAKAAQMMRNAGCEEQTKLQTMLLSGLNRIRDAESQEELLKALAGTYPRPFVVQSYIDLLHTTKEPRVFRELLAGLSAVSRLRYPPWGVLSWQKVKEAAEKVVAGSADTQLVWDPRFRPAQQQRRLKNFRGEAKSILSRMSRLESNAPRRELGRHLNADETPRPSALGYFRKCMLTMGNDKAKNDKAKRDCAAGLRWLALHYPKSRREAVATVQGLLQNPDRPVPRAVSWSLLQILRDVDTLYREGEVPRSGRSRGYCPVRAKQ